MAKNSKNSNYVTEKTLAAKKKPTKPSGTRDTKNIVSNVILIAIAVVVAAAIITGIVFLVIHTSKTEERKYIVPVDGAFEVTDTVELEFEGYGTVKIELYGKEAPETVKNFLHMIEHGELTDKSITVPTSTTSYYVSFAPAHSHEEGEEHVDVRGEFYNNGYANNIAHVAGVLTMDNGSYSDSSSHQNFKILTTGYKESSTSPYNGTRAAFGKVTGGTLSVIEKMMEDYRSKADSTSSSTSSKDELVFGDNKLSVSSKDIENKSIEYSFIPEVSGKYTFTSSKYASIVLDLVTGTAADGAKTTELGTEYTDLKDGVTYELEAGKEYKVKLGLGELKTGTHLITISADILFPNKNTIEISEEDVKAESVTYEYTPNYTGTHFFTSSKLEDKIEIFDGETSLGINSAFLEKGKVYNVIITTKDVESDDYEIVVLEPTLILGSNALEVPVYTFKEGKAVYYFTAEENSKHVFFNKNLDIVVYDANGEKLGDNYVELKKGETYTVEICPKTPSIDLGDNAMEFTKEEKVENADKEAAPEYSKEFLFTAYRSEKYTFTGANLKFEIYNGTKKLDKTSDLKSVSLKAGVQYRVVVTSTALGAQTLNITCENKEDADTEKVAYVDYTISVQDAILSSGNNSVVVEKEDSTAGKIEYTFTAPTTGPYSFSGIYQKLVEDYGDQAKNADGKLVNIKCKFTVFDSEGNELTVYADDDASKENPNTTYIFLEKGEVYTVVLKADQIKAGASATIVIAKAQPKITAAKVVED